MVDKDENEIGRTYPKRAEGLVKKGRAEYADDHRIRLLTLTQRPAVNNTEEIKMSNIINFNARDFSFDKKCESNQGFRGFITDNFGENVQMFEIGDWNWNWTSIVSQQKLEKNTDYKFRFGIMMGHNDRQDEVLRFSITFDNNKDNQMIYVLERDRYKPSVSKKLGDTILRIYEIEFNTGNYEITQLQFEAMGAITQILPVKENSDYSELEDLSYESWWADRYSQNTRSIEQINDAHIDLTGACISEKMLRELLAKAGDGCHIDMEGACVSGDDE